MASTTVQASIIDVTVKTLDGQNRTFNVPEDLNVRQFKEKISASVEISADTQRLIFQGRVMQDDQILKSYNIHGKVIHLVQRAPPTTLSSTNTTHSTTRPTPSVARPHIHLDGNQLDVQINLGGIHSSPSTNEARARVRQVEFNLRIINHVLSQFECSAEVPTGGDPSSAHASRPVSSVTSTHFSENRTETSEADRPSPPRQETSDQQVGLTAVELASLLDQIMDTQNRLLPRIRQYQDLLRCEENYPPNSREAQKAQEVVNRVIEIFHALGHMMHILSDITVNMSLSVPRHAVALSLAPFQMPGTPNMAAPFHVNVRTRQDSNRNRPHQQSSTTATSGSTTTGAVSTAQNAAPDVNRTTESTTNTSVFSTLQNITPSGDSTMETFPTNVTVHDMTTVVTQEFNIETNSSDDSDDNIAENQTSTTVRSSIDEPTSSAPSNMSSSVPSTAASSPPPQRPGTSTFTSSTSTTSTITFESGAGMNLPGVIPHLPQVPGLPSDFLQNILGSILTSNTMFPGQPVQVSVVREVTTSEETAPEPNQQQQHPTVEHPLNYNRPVPRSREHLDQQRSPTASAPETKKSRTDAGTSTSTEKASSTSTSPASNTTTSVVASTINSPSMPSHSANLGPRIPSSVGPRSRSINIPRPYLFHLGSTGQARQPPPVPAGPLQPDSLLPMLLPQLSRGYVDPYLPCISPQYMSQTAQAAVSALQGQIRSHQQVPNLSVMVSGMVGEILGHASQQAVNAGVRTSAGNTSTSTTPNSSSSASAGATTTTTHSGGQPQTAPNPLMLLSQLLGATGGGTGQAGPVPPEFGAMIGSLMQALSAPSAATTAPAWTMSDLLSNVRSVQQDRPGDPSIITSILEIVAPHLGLTDMFSLVMGNGQVLNRVMGPLHEFVKGLVRQHGSIEHLVEVALNNMSPDIKCLQGIAEVKDGVDLVCSVNNCLRAHLLTIFTAIHLDSIGPGGNFGTQLYALWTKLLSELIGLCVYCVRGGYPGFLNMLQSYMPWRTGLEACSELSGRKLRYPRMTQDMSPAYTSWMTVALQSILGSFYHNHPVPESDILGYVARTDATTVPSSKEQNTSKCKTTSTNVPAKPIQSSASVVNHANLSEALLPSTTQSSSSKPPKANIPKPEQDSGADEPFKDTQQVLTSHPPPITHPSTLATQVRCTVEDVNASTVMRNSDEWQSVVPQDWIPVISQDIVRQQDQRPQPPFSDAYLQGLPAKRRRMASLDHSHGMGNMLQYLPDSLKRAAKAAGAQPCSSEEIMAQEAADSFELQSELEKELRTLLGARIISDQEFSLDRFPNAEEYFHKSKQ